MPASMMIEASGETLKVIGSSIAMVASGPTPGSTPTAVPSRAPMKQNSRFAGCAAVARPSPRFWISSMPASRREPGCEGGEPVADQRNRHAQQRIEDHDTQDRNHRGGEQGGAHRHGTARPG